MNKFLLTIAIAASILGGCSATKQVANGAASVVGGAANVVGGVFRGTAYVVKGVSNAITDEEPKPDEESAADNEE